VLSRNPGRRRRATASRRQRGPDGGRPQHVAAGGQASVPAIDDQLRFEARGAVRLQLGGTGLDVEPSCPDAHRAASIGALPGEVDPAFGLGELQAHPLGVSPHGHTM
jgi:hypothetical protein